MALNRTRKIKKKLKYSEKVCRLVCYVCRHLELSAQVSVHHDSAHSVLPQSVAPSFQDVAYRKDTQYSWPICYPCSLHWIATFTFRVCGRTRKRKCLISLMATCVNSVAYFSNKVNGVPTSSSPTLVSSS